MHPIPAFLSITLLAGCSTLTGMGSSEFSCKANAPEEGLRCLSLREMYKATDGGPKPVVPGRDSGDAAAATSSGDAEKLAQRRPVRPDPTPYLDKPVPIRTQAKVMRIYVGPFEDEDADLNVPGLVYTEIEPRRWNLGESMVRKPVRLAPVAAGEGLFRAGASMPVSGAAGAPMRPGTTSSFYTDSALSEAAPGSGSPAQTQAPPVPGNRPEPNPIR